MEKKIITDGIRFSYNGVFDIVEFYRFVEEWMRKKGLEKDIKNKAEYVNPSGKQIEWKIEMWRNVSDEARNVTKLRALFNNVIEVEITKDSSKRRLQQGDVLIIIDGWLESDYTSRWHQKPLFFFLRAVYDKFVWKFWSNRFEKGVEQNAYDLLHQLKAFFNMYRY